MKRDFDKEAAHWDMPPRIKLAQDIAQAIAKYIPLGREMDILDFGCGTGLLSLALKPRVRSVTGMDTSAGMLDAFNKKIASSGTAGVSTLQLDPEKEILIPGRYNLIVSNMTLHHIPEVSRLFKAFCGALLPGGYIALSDLDAEGGQFHGDPQGVFHNGFVRQEIGALLGEAGFIGVEIKDATQITRPGRDGVMRTFGIFLAVGRSPESLQFLP
jgi:2-polyprenyl-3-methyl-5-hydroxy-6-metoxy-1,4-benzoquinol methylase